MDYIEIKKTTKLSDSKFLNDFLTTGWRLIGTEQNEIDDGLYNTSFIVGTIDSEYPESYRDWAEIMRKIHSSS